MGPQAAQMDICPEAPTDEVVLALLFLINFQVYYRMNKCSDYITAFPCPLTSVSMSLNTSFFEQLQFRGSL